MSDVLGRKHVCFSANARAEGDGTEISWFYTKSGIDYQAKGVQLKFEDNTLEELTDGYYLYQIASTDINISEQEAITIATEYAKTISWTANNQKKQLHDTT